MIENIKYKVADFAKDLKLPSKEVIEVLEEKFSQKKTQTVLTEEELNYLFEHYTKKNEVSSFASYFATAAKPKEEKKKEVAPKAEKKQEAKPAEKSAEKPAKAEKPTKAEKAAEKPAKTEKSAKSEEKTPKAENKPEQKTENKPAPKQENRSAPKEEQKTERGDRPQTQRNNDRQGDRPQGQRNNERFGDKPQGQRNNERGDRPQGQRNNDRFGDRPQTQRNNDRFGGYDKGGYDKGGFDKGFYDKDSDNNGGHRHEPKKPVERKPRPSNMPPTEKLAAGVAHVDMSAASVDLDKYNEKYEQIAPATNFSDNYSNKQKLSQRSKQQGKPQQSKREQEQAKLKKLEIERQRRQKLEITLPDEITVGDLALKLKIAATEIIKRLMQQGMMVSVNEVIDYDTAALIAMDIGAKVEHEVVVTIEDRLIDDSEDDAGNLVTRDPVVCVMGHVDHGKTSILDYIRNAHVASGEAGGITQHLGAYRVTTESGNNITFLDTPGHEAFTAMRARGALCTDIAILVVAADDGIMPQTIEAINHAKAAEVSIIVAINKIDKPAANPEKVKQGLTEYGLVPEEWGGDVICVPVSAKTGENIDTLLEMISLVAEVRELKANPDRMAKGTVIESRLDKGRGPVATVLVQNGTLHVGDVVIAGTSVGKIRVMIDDKGRRIESAGPSIPVEITGLDSVPTGGDTFNAVTDEKLARELVAQREYEAKQEQFKAYQKVTLDNLFSQIAEGEIKELPIIVKADVQGSVEAVKQSLEKLSNDEVHVKVIHGAVGAVNESDVMLAQVSNAIIVGFNVRPDTTARDNAAREGVDIRLYRIIYDAIEEIKAAMTGMLAPKFRDVDLGRAEIRQVYKISNVGTVAGCYVLEGKITRSANIRVVRDGIIIADDKLDSLKRFKDDVKEVAQGYECGMALTKFNDIKEGDIFEAYIVEEYRETEE